ncbi:MAG: PhoH family protein [Deltaproteobacteria bacterium]|nr:PhoH family protein [Deltaproteobacteria bacterium]
MSSPAPATLDALFGHRLVVVTGKGGTGKTTVSIALGMAAARRGLRAIVVEVEGAMRVGPALGRAPLPYTVRPVAPGLDALSVTSEAALEEYVVRQVRFRGLYHAVARSRVFGPFMDAVPGLHDIIQVGKVYDLHTETVGGRPRWDVIVLDAPATGHGLTWLASPLHMMEMTVSGPFHVNARRVHAFVSDPERTAVVLVTFPETLPVNETLDLYAGLGPFQPQVACSVLDGVHPPPVLPDDAWPAALSRLETLPEWRESARLTDRRMRRSRAEGAVCQRLESALGIPVVRLPYLPRTPLRPDDYVALAEVLEVGGLGR